MPLSSAHARVPGAIPGATPGATPGAVPAAPQSDATALFDEAVAGPGDRVLILGPPSADLLCEALRHGCRAAQEAAEPPRRPEPADLVVAARITSEAEAAAVADCACRALGAAGGIGRLAALLRGAKARNIARAMARRLRAQGFDRVQLQARAEGALLLVCQLQPSALAQGRRT